MSRGTYTGYVLMLDDPRWNKYATDRDSVAPFTNDLNLAYVFDRVQDVVDALAGYLDPTGTERLNVELFNASSIIEVRVQPEILPQPRHVERVW
jgi:hypothetical protein